MYWITQSAGWVGSSVIVLLTGIGFAFIPLHPRGKIVMFFRTVLSLTVILAGFAKLNEQFIKNTFEVPRPSHQLMVSVSAARDRLDSLYRLDEPDRRAFLETVVRNDRQFFSNIEPRVLQHWIDEAGYSLPSGHTFNAFLLASMLSFCLYELSHRRVTIWLYVPLLWAVAVGVSRVVLGVHTPLDVTTGGALGLLVSHLLLSIPAVHKVIVPDRRRPGV